MTAFLINGRFLSRPTTGVDRVAIELVRALQKRRNAGAPIELSIAVPADAPGDGAIRASLNLDADCPILRSRHRGYGWEQIALPMLQPDAMLLSLCNMGPVLRRRQLVLMHDAQIYDAPGSYSPAFRCAYRLLQPLLARRAQHIATVSDHSAQRLRHHRVGGLRDFHVLPNGIDHLDAIIPDDTILSRLGLQPGSYLLAIGAKAFHKNIPMLLAAHAALPAPRLPLVLVGGGEAGEDVISTGRVSDGELKALYSHARLFLLPSLTEGFGLPALEAMACGCPVLTSDGGALRETCGEAAAYCPPMDRPSWTARIGAFSTSERKLEAMRRAGLAHAARFRWDSAAGRLLQMVESAKQPVERHDPQAVVARG
ncbi:glycosyltransferase family 4 protein [Novosphingobium terrae]|uniref:glycosyltransferase family 4 protein n=1 Tax=Novosphingobium terrae TaxID=2726189 RepID=UPI00197E9F69|nr:glycosyltransferase family 1 protein [Novosphingobium terrae]